MSYIVIFIGLLIEFLVRQHKGEWVLQAKCGTVPLINHLWKSGYRLINYCIQWSTEEKTVWVSHGCLPFLLHICANSSSSFMLVGDWPLPFFMRVWSRVWRLSKGQGFSLTLCQITRRLTDEHSYTAKHVDAIPLLACHIFQCCLPHEPLT